MNYTLENYNHFENTFVSLHNFLETYFLEYLRMVSLRNCERESIPLMHDSHILNLSISKMAEGAKQDAH